MNSITMLRVVGVSNSILRRRAVVSANRSTSRSKSSAAGDEGFVGTKLHHHANTVLAVLFPMAILGTDADSDFGKGLGVLTAGYVSIHSYIGMNYVVTDYVPKFLSKGAVGPSRVVVTGLSLITFAGMSKMALYSPGGIPAVVKGLWNPNKVEEKKE